MLDIIIPAKFCVARREGFDCVARGEGCEALSPSDIENHAFQEILKIIKYHLKQYSRIVQHILVQF